MQGVEVASEREWCSTMCILIRLSDLPYCSTLILSEHLWSSSPPNASKLFSSLLISETSMQESHKKAKKDKCEPLDEDQQFVAELARDLSRVCQVPIHSVHQNCTFRVKPTSYFPALSLQKSAVLEHIWKQDDTWPPSLCRAFILQWASTLESKVLIWETQERVYRQTMMTLTHCIQKNTH